MLYLQWKRGWFKRTELFQSLLTTISHLFHSSSGNFSSYILHVAWTEGQALRRPPTSLHWLPALEELSVPLCTFFLHPQDGDVLLVLQPKPTEPSLLAQQSLFLEFQLF